MSKDAITLNVALFTDRIGPEFENSDAIIPVPASELGTYLSARFGDEIPSHPEDRVAVRQAVEAVGAFSLTWGGHLRDVMDKNPPAYLAGWARAFEPVISKTKTLGMRVDSQLSQCEAGFIPLTGDTTFMAGVFDLSSFAIAMAAAIPHPRTTVKPFMEQSLEVVDDGQTFITQTQDEGLFLEMILQSPLFRKADRLRVKSLRQQGSRIINAAELNIERLRILADRRMNEQN